MISPKTRCPSSSLQNEVQITGNPQRLRLDLTNTFARNAALLANLFHKRGRSSCRYQIEFGRHGPFALDFPHASRDG